MGMENTYPFEVIAGPVTAYIAALRTAAPAIDAEPAAPWTLIGLRGNLNVTDEGVTIEHPQTIQKWRALGDTGARKVFRTEEDLVVRFSIADLTLAAYAMAMNNATITESAGSRKMGMSRGRTVATHALLLRGPSPYEANGYLQWYIPIAAETGSPSVAMKKDTPAGLTLEWTALVDPEAADPAERFGFIEASDASAT